MELYRYDVGYSLEALRADARRATRDWDWPRSAHGHVLSLPRARDIAPSGRYRYQNYPYADRLDDCPAFREIFDSFASPKVSFRLLRRAPGSSYALHHDRWKGPGGARFQVPIFTDPEARLVLTSFRDVEEIPLPIRRLLKSGDFENAAAVAPDRIRIHPLEPGILYHFDTTRVHTLFNPGENERIVLSFDLLVNDWLLENYPEIAAEVESAAPSARTWSRTSLLREYGLSFLHPLRNSLQRWRGTHR